MNKIAVGLLAVADVVASANRVRFSLNWSQTQIGIGRLEASQRNFPVLLLPSAQYSGLSAAFWAIQFIRQSIQSYVTHVSLTENWRQRGCLTQTSDTSYNCWTGHGPPPFQV